MITRQRKNSVLNQLWVPMLAAACLGYFGLSAYGGAYGGAHIRTDRDTHKLAHSSRHTPPHRRGYSPGR